ncbi:MAG TPA: ATP-binding protein, partial [Verrucomicrobiae bacterium]
RYVELQGIVTTTGANNLTLFTRAGKINVLLSPVPPEPLTGYQDCLVRIRGCVVPVRNETSQQVQVGQTRLSNVSLEIDEPAPADPFAAVLKHPSELLQFDARAGSLRRVKVLGQVQCVRGTELFMVDGTSTVRASLPDPASVRAGDLVEVVGFPELGGPSPVIREALTRRVGTAPLPPAQILTGDALFNPGQDGHRITLTARLIGVTGSRAQKVLELQSGNHDFAALVDDPSGTLAYLVNGSILQLTGVYAEERTRTAGQTLASFELLLGGPEAVRELERPPWWTLQRVLLVAGVLVLVILAGACWIFLLHRRVEEAAAKLAAEVRHREKVQQQNLLEQERTRIAKDMHDQLGTSVTLVGLLAELTKKELANPAKAAHLANQICQRALELGRTLDEIVWAVNPKNDSLDKFCDYMAVHAQELFQLTEVLCRVDLPPELPGIPLTAEVRHNLFLATKEALNNAVRHANAREVWIRFKLDGPNFILRITDNGQGFTPKDKPANRNGLENMHKRLAEAGGQCQIDSQPGAGTEVKFTLPLPTGSPPPT